MIHQYVNNGYYLVLDVNSGAVHSVDPLIYDAVQVLAERVPDMEKPAPLPEELCAQVKNALSDRYSAQEIGEALADIQELIDREELFTADVYREYVTDFKKRLPVLLCRGGRVPRAARADEL